MTFDASLDLFALVWALLCTVAAAVVFDSLPRGGHRDGSGRGGGVAEGPYRCGAWPAPVVLRLEQSAPPDRLVSQTEPGVLCSSGDAA